MREFSFERVTPRYDLGTRPRLVLPTRRALGWIAVGAMFLAPWLLAIWFVVRQYAHRIG